MNIRTHIIITISALLVLLASGCSDNAHDPRLTEIAQTVSDNPEEAISALDSINKKDLSSSDRHYYACSTSRRMTRPTSTILPTVLSLTS